MEHQIFTVVDQFRVLVCRKCRHGVRPNEIKGHLKGPRHRLPKETREEVGQAIAQWDNINHDPNTLEIPTAIDDPIEAFEVHHDGLLCEKDPTQCRFITRSLKVMQRHWREKHEWTSLPKGGRPSQRQRERAQMAMREAFRTVACQRVFPSGKGSHYFQVRFPGIELAGERMPPRSEDEVAKMIAQLEAPYREEQQGVNNIIQPSELDEANPWLKRTRWAEYLQGLNTEELLASIEEPMDDDEDPIETQARAIWVAMDGLIRHSQQVVTQVGHQLRIKAVQTEKHQNQHRPLQAYMDQETIIKHMRPWQQMMMFFVRTQAEHEWQSPGYGFTPRQRKTWRVLCQLAEPADSRPSNPMQEEEEEERNENCRLRPLSRIQIACLEFCMELLNQSMRVKEYELALVCALSVLGVREDGFRDPDDYPPILSRVIKVARFMVMVKALRMDPDGYEGHLVPLDQQRGSEDLQWGSAIDTEEYIFDPSQDSGYGTDSNRSTPNPGPPSSIPTSSPSIRDG
jgi:hypothetical protein